jgi:hypothetical protein
MLETAMLLRLSRRRIGRLAADIDMLDTNLNLIALLPELGTMSRKQVAALVGVARYAFDTGKLKGKRCIWAVVRQFVTCFTWRR